MSIEAKALIRAAKAYEAIPDFDHLMLLSFAAYMFWMSERSDV